MANPFFPWGGGFGLWFIIGIALLIWCIVVSIEAKNKGRSGWWIYLICAFFFPLNLVAIILWYAVFRAKPQKIGSITI